MPAQLAQPYPAKCVSACISTQQLGGGVLRGHVPQGKPFKFDTLRSLLRTFLDPSSGALDRLDYDSIWHVHMRRIYLLPLNNVVISIWRTMMTGRNASQFALNQTYASEIQRLIGDD